MTEAFSFFSGIIFDEPSSEFNKSGFNDFMKIMSENLINYSVSKFNELTYKFNASILNESDSESIKILINSTQGDIDKLNELYSTENYYSASSYSVRVGINSLYSAYVIDYLLNQSDLESMIIELNKSLVDFEKIFDREILIDSINDFEAIGISIERLFEAKGLLNATAEYYLKNDSFNALYNLAFAHIRLKTSESWLSLKDMLTGNMTYKFNQEDFSELAYTRIENAKTLSNYAKSMQESYYTSSADDMIDSSVSAYRRGDIVFSLFESLKSISNSNLALSLAGVTDENLDDRISVLMSLAAKNINLAKSKGVMPTMAYSYYEYGQTFRESDPLQAIIFFEYSKQFSMLSEDLANQVNIKTGNGVMIESEDKQLLAKITISFFIGLLFALTVLEVYYERALRNKRK